MRCCVRNDTLYGDMATAGSAKEGNMFWTPRAKDVMAIKAFYP